MCSISLCMIVKNEENSIKRCLSSIADVVDEIIIVDTGSGDRTIDICKEYGAKVYHYAWQENFSAARNFSIETATSDWILWMDADEELIVSDKTELKKLLKNSNKALFVKMVHLLDGETVETKYDYISYHNRLFPNNMGYFFEGIIHERLTCNDKDISEKPEGCDFLSINHYGYRKELVAEKAFRNLKLLLKDKEDNKDNPWIDYHIATELYRLNDAMRAFTFVNNAIGMFILQNKLPPALLYKLKYDILINTNYDDKAINGIEKAIELYPDYVELHFYRGIILFKEKEFLESLKTFSYCLVLGEYNPNYLIQYGNGSFCANYYIGRCYEELGKIEHAKIAYELSVASNAKYKPSLERLEVLLRDKTSSLK